MAVSFQKDLLRAALGAAQPFDEIESIFALDAWRIQPYQAAPNVPASSSATIAQDSSGLCRAVLPVQAPTKYELVINLKTANALGPHDTTIAARPCHEVIE